MSQFRLDLSKRERARRRQFGRKIRRKYGFKGWNNAPRKALQEFLAMMKKRAGVPQ